MSKPFNVVLSDEEREGLEAYRITHGLRSHAEAVRHLIVCAGAPVPGEPPSEKKAKAPTAKPFQTRLKGQWKAP